MKYLLPKEKPVWEGRYANAELILNLVMAAFFVFILPIIILAEEDLAPAIGFTLLIGLSIFLRALYQRFSFHYVISDKRVLSKKGILSQSVSSADFDQISDIRIHQNIIQRLLGTGSIYINTPGRPVDELIFKSIDKPFEVQQSLQKKAKK